MHSLLCFLALGCCFLQMQVLGKCNEILKEKLHSINANEQLILERFFQILIKREGLGYTLFSTKPICLSGYFVQVPLGNMLKGCESNAIRAGWKVWKKNEELFTHPRFLIFEEKETLNGTEIISIYFINKDNLLEIVKKNAALFRKELDINFNPLDFLNRIEQSQSLVNSLNEHEGLLGILLGYGEESSMYYYKKNLIWKYGLPISGADLHLEAISKPAARTDFIHPIYFMGNPKSEDVKRILNQNADDRAYLQEVYSKGNFLETTLLKLMEQ